MDQNINIGSDPQPGGQTPPMNGPAAGPTPSQPAQPTPVYSSPVQPGQYAQVARPVKQRRVGTFTLGIALIMIGVMVPLTMIYHENALMILRFAPAILIMLGIEVLYYAIRYKEAKLRYDGLSIFLVIMMTIVTLIASAVMPFVSNSYAYARAEKALRNETRAQMLDVVDELGYDGRVSCYGDYFGDYGFFNAAEGVPEDAITMHVTFTLDDIGVGKAPTREQAVEAMTKVLQSAAARSSHIEEVTVNVNSGPNQDYYDVNLYRSQLDNVTRELVERRITVYQGYDTGEDYYDESSPEEDSSSSDELPEESLPESVPAE